MYYSLARAADTVSKYDPTFFSRASSTRPDWMCWDEIHGWHRDTRKLVHEVRISGKFDRSAEVIGVNPGPCIIFKRDWVKNIKPYLGRDWEPGLVRIDGELCDDWLIFTHTNQPSIDGAYLDGVPLTFCRRCGFRLSLPERNPQLINIEPPLKDAYATSHGVLIRSSILRENNITAPKHGAFMMGIAAPREIEC